MPDITATEAARRFSDLLDGVEHRGEHYTIIRRGKPVAQLEPVPRGSGSHARDLLLRHRSDPAWREEVEGIRSLLAIDDRT